MKSKIKKIGTRLTRKEQAQINGGSGSCAYYNGSSGSVTYSLSSSQAQGMMSGENDHWCCVSCNDASWFQPPRGLLGDFSGEGSSGPNRPTVVIPPPS